MSQRGRSARPDLPRQGQKWKGLCRHYVVNCAMRDITHKPVTLRTARARGVLFCSAETIPLIRNGQLPKGNLFDVARAAGFLGAKQVPQLLPHCHPVAIDGMDMEFEILDPALHGDWLNEAASRSGIVITG